VRLLASRRYDLQKGDTLVEVLIAIAIVTLILGGAYVTTSHSLQATRAAQERSIALKLAESQIERIKGLAADDPDTLFTASSPFCISAASGLPVVASDTACQVNQTGNPTSSEPIFHISIAKSGNYFVLTETWASVTGKTTENLKMRYRVYE
jgi:prepilin-type N-terminal cleavage/methylation domain-containing protein